MKVTQQATTTGRTSKGFTAEEKAAMKERARELKADVRRASGADEGDTEQAVLDKIAELTDADRVMAERIHAIVKASAPNLTPRLWYGMPAYYRGSNLICHFQPGQKFKSRYATLGFSDKANLDEGTMWPVAFALPELTTAVEARIGALVKQAAS